MNWKILDSNESLEQIIEESNLKPVAIFKHSNTCPISAFAKHNLEKDWDLNDDSMSVYFLDLQAHRATADQVTERFGVPHQSPQVLVIHDGQSIYNVSHTAISVDKIKDAAAKLV